MSDNLCFYGTSMDKEYLPFLKSCVGGATTFVRLEKVSTITEVTMYCKSRDITSIISTSVPLLAKLLNWSEKKLPSLSNYAGSLFERDGIEILFIAPLRQLVTVPYGKFLAQRYINKLVKKGNWLPEVPFSWNIAKPETFEQDFARLSSPDCILIAIDIETYKDNARIRCVAFCGVFKGVQGTLETHATVIPIDSVYNLTWLRKFCWDLKAPKTLQNGKYDAAYLARYNSPMYNWVYDTATLMHCWYSELPKDLGALNAFFVRRSQYWKDMAHTSDLYEYYHYNAKDTYATAIATIACILEMPQWAKDNYYMEFPNVFPCHLAEMTGIKRDMNALEAARKQQDGLDKIYTDSLRKILGEPNFNPGSPKQCLQVLRLLGCKDFKSADEKHLTKARFRHPFNARIVNLIIKARAARTLKSKYLQVGDKAKEFKGRILYALNPHGTDTGRLASKEHHFWCGLQIQNIPRGKEVKQTLMADPGFMLSEVDLEQAESRDTAYISGDEVLIDAVENSPDFHSSNAAKFFGIPFEEIYDTVAGKVIRKDLRTLGKPVNHGANYNMGAYVLIDTMGEKMVLEARNLLGLPKIWSLKEVAEYLLEQFHKTYPDIKGKMYKGIVHEVETTHMIKSMAYHHTSNIDKDGDLAYEMYEDYLDNTPSWTRYTFGAPRKHKPTLNAYVAHPPQNLNAMTLNKAWLKVFFTVAINPKYSDNFKLIAQVHDSILFQYRVGHKYLCDLVKEAMEIPVTIKAYDGKIRTFTVPAGIKAGINGKPAKYWSETE